MSKSVVLPFVVLLALPLAVASTDAAPATAGLAWRGWDRGIEESQKTGRPVLVDVYTDWCGWCKRMKVDVYAKPEVRDYLEDHFVLVELNAESSDPAKYEGKAYTSRSLAARFGVSGYPTTVFLRSGGEHLVSVPGYLDTERFLLVLRYIGEGYMDRGVSFQEFQKKNPSAVPHR